MTSYPRKIARAMLTRARIAAREFRAGRRAPFAGAKFEQRPPSHANAIDLFAGRWATDFSTFDPTWRSGEAKLLADPRPGLAARYLGREGTLDGMTLLELGPLEGAHTYLLEQLGAARILAVEANREAYLKCLIVKEALGISRATFMLGDFELLLRDTAERFDLVFCCGVLYHMQDPLALIRDMARVADRCFVWTHYYDPDRASDREAVPAAVGGFSATYFGARYWDRAEGSFWGGNKPTANWMTRDDIIGAFRHFGFNEVNVIDDQPEAKPGPAFSLAAKRSRNG